jgi:hypothetical protein
MEICILDLTMLKKTAGKNCRPGDRDTPLSTANAGGAGSAVAAGKIERKGPTISAPKRPVLIAERLGDKVFSVI